MKYSIAAVSAVSVYSNGQLQQQGGTKWYDEKGYKCALRKRDGQTMSEHGTFKADEGFSVNGGKKIMANRWDGENGETGILVWNADGTPAKVSVAFGGRYISASEPERGEVDADEPIPANTLRLYMYTRLLQ